MSPKQQPVCWITGAAGLIGSALVQLAPARWRVIALTRDLLDITDFDAVRTRFEKDRPQCVIHCAALSRSAECERQPGLAWRVNCDATRLLAELAADIPLLFFSTDLVFDGEKGLYNEDDKPNPLGVYANTKAAAERAVLANPRHSVVRTSLNGGSSLHSKNSFTEQLITAWTAGQVPKLFTDEFRSPIMAEVTAQAVWDLVSNPRPGLYHIAGAERLSRHEIGQLLAERVPHLNPRIEAASLRSFVGPPRAPDTSLDSSKVQALLSFDLPRFGEWLQAEARDQMSEVRDLRAPHSRVPRSAFRVPSFEVPSSEFRVPYRGRIAPSPTGYLHLGHAHTFWIARQRALDQSGTLVLRNEDLDPARSKPEFVNAFIEDLKWFGFQWQEGPDIGGPFAPYSQSERTHLYRAALDTLRQRGYVYPCTCSRKDLQSIANAPHASDDEIVYPGTCRDKIPGLPTESGHHWRFRVPEGETISFHDGHFGPQTFVAGRDFGDFVIWRNDNVPAYQLAVVVDDAAMKITEVVRGADLLISTARQLLLYRALGLTAPEFYHCPLLLDASGQRLAKRHDALSLRALRTSGKLPEQIRQAEFRGEPAT